MKLTIFKRSNIHLLISLVFLLLLTQTYLSDASIVNDITNFQEQANQNGEGEAKLSRYENLIRSSGELLADHTLFEKLFDGVKQVAPSVRVQHLNTVSGKAKKLLTWVRRQSFQDSSQEDEDTRNALESRGSGKAEHLRMAKRVVDCAPLKEQFKKLRGKLLL